MSSGPTRSRAWIIGVLTLIAPVPALAQTTHEQGGGALDRYDPAPAGDTFFSLPSADVPSTTPPTRLRFAAAATLSYAHDPLVLRVSPDAGASAPLSWVGDQTLLHLQLSAEVLNRLKLDVDVPVLVQEGGTTGTLGGFSVTAPSGAHVGDLRIEARGAVLHQSGLLPAVGVTFAVWAPTGSAASFAGAGVIRYEPGVVIGAEYEHLVWGASVGTRFQHEVTNGVAGSQITGGAGVAARFLGLTVGPELLYGVSLGDPRGAIFDAVSGNNAEVLLAARYRVGPIVVGLAGGPGLGHGPGTPSYRLLAGISGSFDALPADGGEGEGARERVAPGARPAPVGPEPIQPEGPLDTDGDGVPDADDACPTIVGDATPGAYRRGCPPDRDHDGIPDAEDACPDVPGVASSDPTRNGCPGDSDGDGIPDDKDACPNEKGPANADPKLNGCPTAVRVEGSQIVILQQINFDTNKDTITKDSFGILEQVAAVLEQHPEIARLAVDGHTDNRGGEEANKNLSERRALAVVRWLIEHGVDARRLEARGFGQRRPIAANITTAGRAQNRRVEFLIRRRTDLGKAGWVDGSIEEIKAPTAPAPAEAAAPAAPAAPTAPAPPPPAPGSPTAPAPK